MVPRMSVSEFWPLTGHAFCARVVLAARGRYDSSSVLQTELRSSLFARRNPLTIILYLCAIGDAIAARALPVLSVDLTLVAEGLVE
jgi:hypothetical protein